MDDTGWWIFDTPSFDRLWNLKRKRIYKISGRGYVCVASAGFVNYEKFGSEFIMDNITVSLDSKILLNVKEASDLFGIGQNRLRDIVREDYGNKYHLMLGRTIKIKRKQFEEFIDKVEQL